jgi:hypothetical protein
MLRFAMLAFAGPTVLRVTGGRVPGRQAGSGRAGCGPRFGSQFIRFQHDAGQMQPA